MQELDFHCRCSKAAASEMKIRTACVAINDFVSVLYLLFYIVAYLISGN